MNEDTSAVDTDNLFNKGNDSEISKEEQVETPLDSVEVNPLEEAKIEIAELKDKYLRLYADFENFRRRTSKEKLELISSASSETVKSVIPVIDDFERALQAFETSQDFTTLKEGVELIYTKLSKTLESNGLKPMNSKGELFDADIHESIAQFPASSEEQKGKVIEEVEKGYYLNDKVIRYAKVVVAI